MGSRTWDCEWLKANVWKQPGPGCASDDSIQKQGQKSLPGLVLSGPNLHSAKCPYLPPASTGPEMLDRTQQGPSNRQDWAHTPEWCINLVLFQEFHSEPQGRDLSGGRLELPAVGLVASFL